MKLGVELAFDADIVVGAGVGIVAYETDDTTGQGAVRILPDILLRHYEAALVLALAEQRELLDLLQRIVVHGRAYGTVAPVVLAVPAYLLIVFVCGLLREETCQPCGQLACLAKPFLFACLAVLGVLGEFVLEDGRVHGDGVGREGDGQHAAVAGEYRPPGRTHDILGDGRCEFSLDDGIRLEEGLYTDELAHQDHRPDEEKDVEDVHDPSDPVPLSSVSVFCHSVTSSIQLQVSGVPSPWNRPPSTSRPGLPCG